MTIKSRPKRTHKRKVLPPSTKRHCPVCDKERTFTYKKWLGHSQCVECGGRIIPLPPMQVKRPNEWWKLTDKLFDLEKCWFTKGRTIDIIENDKLYSIIQVGIFKDDHRSVGMIPISTKLEILTWQRNGGLN